MPSLVGASLPRLRRGTSPSMWFAAWSTTTALVAATLLVASAPAQATAGDSRAVTAPESSSDVTATWMPDSASIVFSRVGANGTPHLWRQRLNRTTAVPLFDRDRAWRPRISPDGSRVVFTAWEHVKVLNLSTGRVTNVGEVTGLDSTREASWSPNGRRLVFSGSDGGQRRLYTSSADGTGLAQISDIDDASPHGPEWSPDGTTISFVTYVQNTDTPVVKLVDADGSNKRVLATGAMEASWSPDSSRLVVKTFAGGSQMRILRTDGSLVEAWPALNTDQQLSWSPDGNYVSFTRGGRIWVRSLGPDIPTPTPAPPPSVSIDAGAVFTNSPQVTLHVTAPESARTMTVSNDGGFSPARTFEADNRVPWTLISSGADRLPKTVYVRFDGTAGVYTDDIILDETDPAIASATVSAPLTASALAADRALTRSIRTRVLRLKASDDRSGVRRLQVNRIRSARSATTYRYDTRLRTRSWRRTFVRVRDGAGNWSPWRRARRAA